MNQNLINELIEKNSDGELAFQLLLDNKMIKLINVQILKIKTPVKQATERGGVYFSDTTTYKITAETNDLTILNRLKDTMLGPNDKFEDIKIKASNFLLICNLTNRMHNSSIIQLHFNINDITRN